MLDGAGRILLLCMVAIKLGMAMEGSEYPWRLGKLKYLLKISSYVLEVAELSKCVAESFERFCCLLSCTPLSGRDAHMKKTGCSSEIVKRTHRGTCFMGVA